MLVPSLRRLKATIVPYKMSAENIDDKSFNIPILGTYLIAK